MTAASTAAAAVITKPAATSRSASVASETKS